MMAQFVLSIYGIESSQEIIDIQIASWDWMDQDWRSMDSFMTRAKSLFCV